MKHYTAKNYTPTSSVGFSLTRARNVVIAEMDAAMSELGITSQQMGIILSVARDNISTPFELSKKLDIDTGLMTRMLDKLELQGLLIRTRSIEDRRSVNLRLTPRGNEIADAIPLTAPEVLNRRLQKFTADEFEEFRRLLNKFLEG